MQWLTIPVEVKGRYEQRIDETRISDPEWAEPHWKTLAHNYGAAPYFDEYSDTLPSLYARPRSAAEHREPDVPRGGLLDPRDRHALSWSTDYEAEGTKTERLVEPLPGGRRNDVPVWPERPRVHGGARSSRKPGSRSNTWTTPGYPEYPQLHPPFDHAVTMLDLIFNTGADAPRFMKSFAERQVACLNRS